MYLRLRGKERLESRVAEIKPIGRYTIVASVFCPKLGFETLLLDLLKAWIKKSRDQHGCRVFDLYRRPGDT
jgi:hypothetical protein